MNRLVIAAALLTVVSCTKPAPPPSPEGAWKNLTFRIEVNKGAADSTGISLFEVLPDQWEQKLGLKPIVTRFEADGTYASEHWTPADSLLFTASGTWKVSADSLTFEQLAPRTARYTLAFRIAADTAHFSGYLDWDSDGAADDYYTGKQIRLRPESM